ncbi:MAG: TonB-dependent receptor [Cytophagaceae bacterium]
MKLLYGIIFYLLIQSTFGQHGNASLKGQVTDSSGVGIPGIIVMLKGTPHGTSTDTSGHYHIKHVPAGEYKVVIGGTGFISKEHSVKLIPHQHVTLNSSIEQEDLGDGVVIEGKSGIQEIKESSYTVNVIDATQYANRSADINQVLNQTSGVRIRESGGLGSSYNFSLNGFTGRQVKFFVDGVPIDNFGSSFQLNNIPINLAERIEVYKGVVPIWLGADALGGAINVVTSTKKQKYLDVSYSYGSFNTHRTSINAGYTTKSGFIFQVNAFQNYSDNNYWVTVDNADVNTGLYNKIRVRRFHDTYRNETLIAQVGVVNKKYADRLLIGFTVGQNQADIQTGARMVTVFGDMYRTGTILMPSIRYQKNNFIIKNLNLNLTGNYNFGKEQNIDTVARRYNWKQEYIGTPSPGSERNRTLYKYSNNTMVWTGNMVYKFNSKHSLMLNNVFNSFNRVGYNELDPDNESLRQPRITRKNILAVGYKFDPNTRLSVSIFAKQFMQNTIYSRSQQGSGGWGTTEYVKVSNKFNATGYGAAASYFLAKPLQVKASFEKSYRLPDNDEIFGDMINLEGNTNLRAENSFNINLGLAYAPVIKTHHKFLFDIYFIYRDVKDFIRPQLNTNQTHTVMTNQGRVKNNGINAEIRYSYRRIFSVGANGSYQNLRNHDQFDPGSKVESPIYLDRIPNMPFLFANADANVGFGKIGGEKNRLSFGYNLSYVHFYYLKWPSQGGKDDKNVIPMQLSHDINISYSIQDGRYNISLDCRNILDAKLYDNFTLQKPGRAFYIKLRYNISK